MRLNFKKLGLLGILLLGCGRFSFALTAAQIISEARVFLKDQSTSENRQQFSDAQLLAFLNDGQREANVLTWVLQTSTTFTLSGGTTFYAMPTDFLATARVYYKNSKIDQTSYNQLDATSIGWKTASGTPNSYYLDQNNVITYMGFYPAPATSSTGTVIVYYVQQPLELTVTTQVPWNGWNVLLPYHSSLAYYVAFRGYLTLEETEIAQTYSDQWNQSLMAMRQGFNKMPDFNPGFSGRRGP